MCIPCCRAIALFLVAQVTFTTTTQVALLDPIEFVRNCLQRFRQSKTAKQFGNNQELLAHLFVQKL
jgi:hypothetical protein